MARIRETKKTLVKRIADMQTHIDLLERQATRERLVRAKLAIVATRKRTLKEAVIAGY